MICWSFWFLCRDCCCLAFLGLALGWVWDCCISTPFFVCPTGVLGYHYGSWVARGVWDTFYCLVGLI